jgi:hypothetical protein
VIPRFVLALVFLIFFALALVANLSIPQIAEVLEKNPFYASGFAAGVLIVCLLIYLFFFLFFF